MFIETTRAYSTALARNPRYHSLIAPLLREAEILNANVANLERQAFFQMLVPWIEQIGSAVSYSFMQLGEKSDASNRAAVGEPFQDVFKSLLRVTVQSHRSSVTAHIVNDMWIALMNTEHTTILIPEVVMFLINQYMSIGLDDDDELEPDEKRALLKMTFVAITRGECSNQVFQYAIDLLRSYPTVGPQNVWERKEWYSRRALSAEDITAVEVAAFELLINAAYENGSAMRIYLPRLLQNAFILFNGSIECAHLLYYVALSLDICNLGDNKKDVTPEELTTALIKRHPAVCDDWIKEALAWGVGSTHPDIAGSSMALFTKLQNKRLSFGADHDDLLSLCFAAFECATSTGQQRKLKEVVAAMSLPARTQYKAAGWLAVMSIGWSLMQYTYRPYYECGQELMLNVWEQSGEKGIEWLGRFGNGKHSFFDGRDKSLADVVFKGLTSSSTRVTAMALLGRMSTHFAADSQLPPQNFLMCLFLSSTIIFCLADIFTIVTAKPGQELPLEELFLQPLRSCITACEVLQMYEKMAQNQQKSAAIKHIIAVFQNISTLISEAAPKMGSIEFLQKVDSLRLRLRVFEQNDVDVDFDSLHVGNGSRSANEMMSASARTLLGRILRSFCRTFLNMFCDQEFAGSLVDWHTQLLSSWRHSASAFARGAVSVSLLLSLGHILRCSRYQPTSIQQENLGDVFAQYYYEGSEQEHQLVEDVASIMCAASKVDQTSLFSFVRPRCEAHPKKEAERQADVLGDHHDFGEERRRALSHLEAHALRHMQDIQDSTQLALKTRSDSLGSLNYSSSEVSDLLPSTEPAKPTSSLPSVRRKEGESSSVRGVSRSSSGSSGSARSSGGSFTSASDLVIPSVSTRLSIRDNTPHQSQSKAQGPLASSTKVFSASPGLSPMVARPLPPDFASPSRGEGVLREGLGVDVDEISFMYEEGDSSHTEGLPTMSTIPIKPTEQAKLAWKEAESQLIRERAEKEKIQQEHERVKKERERERSLRRQNELKLVKRDEDRKRKEHEEKLDRVNREETLKGPEVGAEELANEDENHEDLVRTEGKENRFRLPPKRQTSTKVGNNSKSRTRATCFIFPAI